MAWLDLLDGGRCAGSWDAAAPVFKGMITRDDRYRAVSPAQALLDRCLSRCLRSHELVERLRPETFFLPGLLSQISNLGLT
jgi:hypothetical protein